MLKVLQLAFSSSSNGKDWQDWKDYTTRKYVKIFGITY